MRIMQDVAHLSLYETGYIFCIHAGLVLCEFRIIPVCTNKNRMVRITFQNGFDNSIQNILLIGEMAVKGYLADTYRIGELRDTGCFISSVNSEQIQCCLQYFFPCVALLHTFRPFSNMVVTLNFIAHYT